MSDCSHCQGFISGIPRNLATAGEYEMTWI